MQSWSKTWMALSHLIASRSKDGSFKAGAVLVGDDNKTVLGLGFNGAAPSISDDYDQKDRWLARALTSHAESNSLWYAGCAHGRTALVGSTLYVNGRPCHQCVKEAVRAGVQAIVWDDTNPNQPGMCDDEDCRKSYQLSIRSGLKLIPYSTMETTNG